jgi:4'-phosphopantetheinyl transferase
MIPETPALNPGEIHLWHLDLTASAAAIPGNLLDAQEQERAARFRVEPARRGFALTRSRLRTLLGQYLGRAPQAIAFDLNDHGKPRLQGQAEGQGLVFNVSHSGTSAVLGFALDTALGVDIEAPRDHRDLDGLATACLNLAELERWRGLAAEQRLAEFLRYWVCKEALVKAVGRGIALGLTKTVVKPGFDGYARLPEDCGTPEEWQLKEWTCGANRLAVAYRGAARAIQLCGPWP